jgi:D-alanyl-lipoteichoic acid acyltransferase DltB (MBOAT superfamily)
MTHAKKQIHIYLALIFSFVMLGFWHGDSSNYLIYGLLNGLAIVGSLIFKKIVLDIKKSKILNIVTWIFTFIFFISIPTLFLKSHNLTESIFMLKQIFGQNDSFLKISKEGELIFLKLMPFLFLIVTYEIWELWNAKFFLLNKVEELPKFYLIPIVFIFLGLLMVAYSFNIPHAKFIYQGF